MAGAAAVILAMKLPANGNCEVVSVMLGNRGERMLRTRPPHCDKVRGCRWSTISSATIVAMTSAACDFAEQLSWVSARSGEKSTPGSKAVLRRTTLIVAI